MNDMVKTWRAATHIKLCGASGTKGWISQKQKQRMKTKAEHRCTAKAKDAQAFVARMDSAKTKHIGYKTVSDLR